MNPKRRLFLPQGVELGKGIVPTSPLAKRSRGGGRGLERQGPSERPCLAGGGAGRKQMSGVAWRQAHACRALADPSHRLPDRLRCALPEEAHRRAKAACCSRNAHASCPGPRRLLASPAGSAALAAGPWTVPEPRRPQGTGQGRIFALSLPKGVGHSRFSAMQEDSMIDVKRIGRRIA